MSEINLDKPYYDRPKDFYIKHKDGRILDVVSIETSNDRIVSVTTSSGEKFSYDEIECHHNIIYIPGMGYVTPETRVVYQDEDYILKYGWHLNVSNQNICSWYLSSLNGEKRPDRTLYRDMADKITAVHFR